MIVDVGKTSSESNANLTDAETKALNKIAGKKAGAILSTGVGVQRIVVEFGCTGVTESGEIIKGELKPEDAIGLPLAAAIRAAEEQYLPASQPIPPAVQTRLATFIPKEVLANSRWVVGELSISIPDLVNLAVKKFQGADNAVTVNTVTVFSTDPGDNYHWWAHELWHHVQYNASGGIDGFAKRYVTSCHAIEREAEQHAQEAELINPDPYKPFCP